MKPSNDLLKNTLVMERERHQQDSIACNSITVKRCVVQTRLTCSVDFFSKPVLSNLQFSSSNYYMVDLAIKSKPVKQAQSIQACSST